MWFLFGLGRRSGETPIGWKIDHLADVVSSVYWLFVFVLAGGAV